MTPEPTRYFTTLPATWKTTNCWCTTSDQPPWDTTSQPHLSALVTHACPWLARPPISSAEVTLPPNLERHFTRTLVIARIAALSTQALAYFLQALLNAAIRFRVLHLTHPKHMLRRALTTVQHAWAIVSHPPTSLPVKVCEASALYYGDGTDHMVQNSYTAHAKAHVHHLMHNQELEVREVFTLTLREAQHQRNTCPQYILHQQGLPTTVGTRV